jgi:HK97 family phage major capsid protein
VPEQRSTGGKQKLLSIFCACCRHSWESRAKFDKIQKDVEQLEADAQRMQAFESREAQSRSFERSPRPGVNTGTQLRHMSGDEQRDRANQAFRAYARTGQIPEEYRDVLTTSDTVGGALVPQMFEGVLHDAEKFYGPIAQYVDRRETDKNGAPMKYSFSNDTSNSLTLLATEGTSSPAETDPGFFSKIVGVDTVTGGLVKVSFQEIDDSSFDLDSAIRRWFGIRYARALRRRSRWASTARARLCPISRPADSWT